MLTLVRGDLSPELLARPWWTDDDLASEGIPVVDSPVVSVGGGMGAFALVSYLRQSGMPSSDIRVIGPEPVPYTTYRYLCNNSQIDDETRIRSDSSSIMDSVWGWPGYAVREAFGDRPEGFVKPLWSVLTEPLIEDYWTPRAGQVFRSIDREMPRLAWQRMYVPGLVRTVRRRVGGGYFVVNTPPAGTSATRRVAYRSAYVHIGIGYPGLRFLPDLQNYRQQYGDHQRVVNAYEPHEHVYAELRRRPGVVVVRGSGIVGSRILERLISDRDRHGAQTVIWHLFRNYVGGPQGPRRFRRHGADGFAYQGFNFCRAAWGGTTKEQLAAMEPSARPAFIRQIGGTNTPWRDAWQDQLQRGRAEGFYRTFVGQVNAVSPGPDGTVVTNISGTDGTALEIPANFIIDATGLEATIDDHRVLRELIEFGGARTNPHGRMDVDDHFELVGTRSEPGRMYASGSITLGGPYAPVDSFLGLQHAALQICDDLASQGAVRRFVTLVVGVPWTLLLAWILPGITLGGGLAVLIAMGEVGLGWELLYHWLMGYRWEKDWPSLIALLTGVNEALLLGVLLGVDLVPGASPGPAIATFLLHFVTVWLLIWAWLQGPMKVFDPRWRFRGGRVL